MNDNQKIHKYKVNKRGKIITQHYGFEVNNFIFKSHKYFNI